MLRLLFAIVGYTCTATVIAMVLGAGYLWQSDRLNDEKAFHVVALLHDIDLHQLASETKQEEEDVPAEEPSLAQLEQHGQTFDRNVEVKLLALRRGQQEFDFMLSRLEEKTDRFDRLAQEWQQRLQQQGQLTTEASVANVVRNLQMMPAEAAKEDLVRMMQEDRTGDVIMLIKAMSTSKLKNILKRFKTDDELGHVHEIHRLMLEGYPEKPELDRALQALDAINTEE